MKLMLLLVLMTFAPYLKAIDQAMLLENERNNIVVYKAAVKSVVNVSNIRLARSFWNPDVQKVPQGSGSGFVWDSSGHIVTNYHVIDRGVEFLVTFQHDKKQYKAKLLGGDPRKDIAVLKLEERPKEIFPVTAGTSADLEVGQKAIAIGNPFGLDHTMTTGIISALNRQIQGYGEVTIHGMIQTDSSINPGNSGGPLLDSSGKLIGMNTMIYSNSGSSAGIGFAVPVDTINKVVPEVIKYGRIKRPGLGISLLEDHYKMRLGLEKGVVIATVDPKGPAGSAGLRGMSETSRGYIIGDVITAIGSKEVNTYDDIFNVLDNYKIGDTVQVSYLKDGKVSKKASIKLYEITSH
jgi:S1-C subfamily serine protease